MPKRMVDVPDEEALTTNVSFRISPQLQAEAKKASRHTGLPVSTILRRALECWGQDPEHFVATLWPEDHGAHNRAMVTTGTNA
ncbi:MAG: hypothetical protein KKA73_03015 [Chloroflexi bacterium]|nr:hypothetical protein [Chloroflexota bacterium]MBU1746635.1 hypothetical protein [Chloroflexota bacterium]